MHARGHCFAEAHAPVGGSVQLTGLARYFEQKYPLSEYTVEERGERIYEDLWVESYKGIAVHEVGHSLGLLHNFASSWDAANYHPAYWQLRTREGTASESCNGVARPEGDDTCMGPRYLDPETEDELGLGEEPRPEITYFGNSSVMEYSLERFGETVGLGQYDLLAMKALYGRVLETYDEASRGGLNPEEAEGQAPRLSSQLSSDARVTRSDGPFAGQVFPKPTHYTELGRMLRLYDSTRCREATDAEKANAGWRIVRGQVCAPAPRDHAAWQDFEEGSVYEGWDTVAPLVRTKADTATGAGKVRWAYRYGATFNSYFHTQAADAGADEYEVTVNAIEKFDGSYPWTYFRRSRREFAYNTLPLARAQRYFEQLRAYHWQAANRNAFFRSFGEANFEEIAGSDDWHRPLVVAETEVFSALARYILTPQPGSYAPMSSGGLRSIYDVGGNQTSFDVEVGEGRFIDQDFDSGGDGGGSWNYLEWLNYAGFGVEKIYAMMALADGRPVLSTISRENYLDGRDTRINFRADMPVAVDRLIGGILAEDWAAVGPFVGDEIGASLDYTALFEERPRRPGGARVLFPNIGYKQQLGMLIFAHLYSRRNTDLTLTNKL
ncbi:MAG: zinc-dependent metalloprotease, partial [Myxococcota bacterium]